VGGEASLSSKCHCTDVALAVDSKADFI